MVCEVVGKGKKWVDQMFLNLYLIILFMMSSGSASVESAVVREVRQFRSSTDLQKFLFSEELCLMLQKLLRYDYEVVISLANGELKEACQKELRRIQSLKLKEKIPKNLYLDNQLAATAIQHQVRAIAELIRSNQDALRRLAFPNKGKPVSIQQQDALLRRYAGIQGEIQKSEGAVRQFMESEVLNRHEINLHLCIQFFKRQARRLRRSSGEKIILSRAHLLDALSYCLKMANKMLNPDSNDSEREAEPTSDSNDVEEEQIDQEQLKGEQKLSYQQINRWRRLSSGAIQGKLAELASVCEQIPQLEAFNRNMQFSQLENRQRVVFLRVVDVLISLHHRVSYLSRNKPQLLRELQQAQQQLVCLNNGCEAFLEQLQQQMAEMAPLSFSAEVKKHNQLSEPFVQLRRKLIKMAEVIVSQDQFHTQGFHRADRLAELVQLYIRAVNGEAAQWQQLVQSVSGEGVQGVSEEQCELVMHLQECLLEYQNKVILVQQMEQQSTTKTNEELQEEVNKLISDYERLKAENKQQLQSLELLTRVKEELEMEIQERDNMIYNLSGLKVALEKRLANTENATNHSVRVEDQLKKQERQTQKYLQSSLLLREQLKVSESERQKLMLLVQSEKEKYLKVFQASSRLKPEKERLQRENQQLQERIEKMKNDHQRQLNKLKKQADDLTNERDLLQQQLKTAQANTSKLMTRLQANQKRIADYSKMVINRVEQHERTEIIHRTDHTQTARLQDELERSRRETQRIRKQLQSRRVQMDVLERESTSYQLEISALKAKLKETRLGQEESQEKDDIIRQLRTKLEKNANKINALNRQLTEARDEEEQAVARNRTLSKRIKELESALADQESQTTRISQQLQQKTVQASDLQKALAAQASNSNIEITHLRQQRQQQQNQLREKASKLQHMQRKIERLQAQLAAKRSQGEQASRELVEVKIKQYETTLQTHKLLEIKLEQQARTLKNRLQQKIQVQIKLNLQIDRLSKEIDRMKQQLQKFMRELNQKELVIKRQRQRYQEQVKIIREYEVKENIQQEGFTPIRPHSHHKGREQDTPSHIDQNHQRRNESNDPNDSILSKSNVKYDIYFNAKQYDRLQKEYNQFKATIGQRIDQLQRNLNEAMRAKVELEIKCNNLVAENKRIITSKTINSNNINGNNINEAVNNQLFEFKRKSQNLQIKLNQSNSIILQLQSKIKELNETTSQLQERLKIKQQQTKELRKKSVDEVQLNNELGKVSIKITELQVKITHYEQTNQALTIQNNQYVSKIREMQKKMILLEQELSQAKHTINNIPNSAINSAQSDKLKQNIQQLNDQLKIERERKNDSNDQIRQKQQAIRIRDQAIKQRDQAIKEKEFLLKQQQDWRRKLAEQSKRTLSLQTEITRLQQQIKLRVATQLANTKQRISELDSLLEAARVQLRIQRERKGAERQDANVQWYLQKIRSLQEALAAVGDELSDCKQALYRELSKEKGVSSFNSSREFQLMFEDNQRLWNDNHMLAQANQQISLQCEALSRRQTEWTAKERLYLQQLEALSRENVSLKDLMNKPSEKQITTTLPPRSNPINTNYHEGQQSQRISRDFEEMLRQMDAAIEGRARWQGGRLLQSLQRWRVPLIVCKEIQQLLTYLSQMVQMIKFLRNDYATLHNLSPDALLFENLLEFVFRVLVYFSEIESKSAEAGRIRSELAQTGKKYKGGIFFTVLQEFTIHILENNAIEEYKRELRTKAKQLLQIKEKLDELITRQIEQQQKIVNRPQSHRSRDTTPYRDSLNASPKPLK